MSVPVRILAGWNTNITDDAGNAWIGYGNFFADGETIERPDATIKGVGPKDAKIYQAERYSMTKFTYSPVPNGDYTVKLHFCETYDGITAAAARVFSYSVNGQGTTNFDIFAKVGFQQPIIQSVPITVSDHKVEVDFFAGVENPQINGIEILPGH